MGTHFSNPTSQSSLVSLLLKSKIFISQILQIHAQLITTALINDIFNSNTLLLSISNAKNVTADYADLVFIQIHKPNTFSWNTIIRFHSQTKNPLKALLLFRQMRANCTLPDNYTYPFVLKACSILLNCQKEVWQIHGDISKRGFYEDLLVRNGIISVYCKIGEIEFARKIFVEFEWRDLVSWNSIIAGYVNCGYIAEAQKVFDEMPERDACSWTILINGYGKKFGDIARARELFDNISKKDLVCWNCMIDGYASLGMINAARELFEMMSERNVISWSILIDCYASNGCPKEALELFHRMLSQGLKPDKISAVSAVSACAYLGALDHGRWIHLYLKKNQVVFDVVLQTALIDMYMKCGSLDVARSLFDSMPYKTVVTWNVMIVGLGNNGFGCEAVDLFYRMVKVGAFMDDLTFVGVLAACTHAGLVSEGWAIFNRMRIDFKIEPKLEHYTCLVDLLGRAGQLQEARALVDTMPMRANAALWGSLLAACRNHQYVDLAEHALKQLRKLGADDGGVYALMSNIYSEEGMWDNACRMRKLMSVKGMKKETGSSLIEVDGKVHEFVYRDFSHPQKDDIYVIVGSLMKLIGNFVIS